MATHYTWIKAYTEILHDPKMGRMSDHLWRRCMEIFLIAGETGKGGELPTVDEMAWTLHTTADELSTDLKALENISIIRSGVVVHFAERQAAMSDKERQQRHRAGVTKPSQGSNEVVTEEEVEEEVDINKDNNKGNPQEPESALEPPQPPEPQPTQPETGELATISRTYEREIGAITAMTRDTLTAWLYDDKYPVEWILAAIRESVNSNARNINYVQACLKNWKAKGRGWKPTKPSSNKQSSKKMTNFERTKQILAQYAEADG